MDAFLTNNFDKLKALISDVHSYDKSLKSLSEWWGKIALIGKINSLDVASTILEDMDSARTRFHKLQETLIANLTQQHAKKAMLHHQSRCQMAIDVLIRNLFERTADIGFLSKDDIVVAFIEKAQRDEADNLTIRQRLQDYVNKYSVYNDVLLVASNGDIIFQLSQPSSTGNVSDPCVLAALNSTDQYVEFYGSSQLMKEDQEHLLYLHSVQVNGRIIGAVALCFQFLNEASSIFAKLNSDANTPYLFVDRKGKVLNFDRKSARGTLPAIQVYDDRPSIVRYDNKEMLLISVSGHPYQNYPGPKGWRACALVPLSNFSSDHKVGTQTLNDLPAIKDLSRLFSIDLINIREHSTLINDDLELIVLNGTITAARSQSAEFMPVLEAIKNIGRDIDSVFAKSIESLFITILSSQLDKVKLQAELAVDILDRNLYERANDCRWWALNPKIREGLAKTPHDDQTINHTLKNIHEFYTVYHDLYVYDRNKQYVAFSLPESDSLQGTTVPESSACNRTLQLKDSQDYCVSPFMPFDIYQGQSTYIYNAAIHDMHNPQKILGGIGVVFDASKEFQAILKDAVTEENSEDDLESKPFAVFTDLQGAVVSCSDDRLKVGDKFFPNINLDLLKKQGSLANVIHYNSQHYMIGAALSQGYREFKKQDGYVEPIIAWVLLPA